LTFNAGKYMYYNDADCPSGPTIDHSKAVPGLRQDGDVVFVPGRDANGNNLLVKVLQQRDPQTGAVTQRSLEVYRQRDATNVDVTTVTLSPAAQVQTVSQTVQPGQITNPSTSPTASSTPDVATTTPTANVDPTKQPTIVFPDDYARENTSQATKSGIDQLHKDLTDTESVDDPLIPEASRFTDSFFSGTFDGIKGWSLPSHSSVCPTGTFAFNNTTYTMDAHCQLANNHFGALQAAMAVVWSLLALFIVLKA
jgi:hypothetical protein